MLNRQMHSSKSRRLLWPACFCGILVFASFSSHASDTLKRDYETSFANVVKICAELHQALDPAKQRQLKPEPVLLEQVRIPRITSATSDGTSGTASAIQVSAGIVEWINRASHARALDESNAGCFARCVSTAIEDPNGSLPAIGQGLAPETVWGFDTMNYQAGIFNQMTGGLLAIDMAHHYLGHYKKHSAQLASAGEATSPICSVLSEKEWREAVMKGARNALDCGLGVDGLRAILDEFEKLPGRPAWSAQFVHPKANLGKLSRELDKMVKDFFLVEK